MAGDSAIVYGETTSLRQATPKVFVVGPYAIGTAGDAAGDHVLNTIEWDPRESWFRERCYKLLRAAVVSHTCEDKEPGVDLLIGCRGVLYRFDGTSLVRLADKVAAVGCAEDMLLGFLHGSQLEPRSRVRAAVRLACDRHEGCGGPVRVVSV